MITPWSIEKREEFRVWHEALMKERGYPEKTVRQFRRDREKFMPKPPTVRQHTMPYSIRLRE